MQTEETRQLQELESIRAKMEFNEQVIVAAAKYERILNNKDFLAILGDLKNVKLILDTELNSLTTQIVLTDDSLKKAEVINEFTSKAIRRRVIEEAISYPEKIVYQASLAKEENIQLKDKLKENNNG